MKATSIPAHEQSFFITGIDAQGKKFKLKKTIVDIPGSTQKITFVDCTRDNGDESFFYKEAVTKERIVLHYTAGYLKGDISRLTTQGDHVSVPYVIARSGQILRLWNDAYWSYHLGAGVPGGNTEMSKRSIGIEISNIGYLAPAGQNLVTAYGNNDVYCALADANYYTALPTPYRGKKYYASFTAAQYASVKLLLTYLCAQHPTIPFQFLEAAKRFDVLANPAAFKGIVSHVNFRTDKWDIGPGFEWGKITS